NVFLRYVDESGYASVDVSDDETYDKYLQDGIHPDDDGNDVRYNSLGETSHMITKKTKLSIIQEQARNKTATSPTSAESTPFVSPVVPLQQQIPVQDENLLATIGLSTSVQLPPPL
ncbi:unnamed protein product, partial [Owenia fusiformis]